MNNLDIHDHNVNRDCSQHEVADNKSSTCSDLPQSEDRINLNTNKIEQIKNQETNDDDDEEGFQDVTRESLVLYSNIKSQAKLIYIIGVTNQDGSLDEEFKSQEGIGSDLDGYEIIGHTKKGGQAQVLKLYKESAPILVIKLYRKEYQTYFQNEVCVLGQLRADSNGGLGILKFIETLGYFGIIMSAGVGTLHDFREFLTVKKIDLTEGDLKTMHMGLMRNYEAIKAISILHRDIKPENVILHPGTLNLEIIDYGMAVHADSKKNFPGGIGTEGFIDPKLFGKGEYTKEELLQGDYFSLGVTLLYMANRKLRRLTQGSVKNVTKEYLDKLCKNKNKMWRCLNGLITEKKDLLGNQAKSKNVQSDSGYPSGLCKYQNDFLDYIYQKNSENIKIIQGFEDPKPRDTEHFSVQNPKLSPESFEKNAERSCR